MTLEEIGERMSARELAEWQAYYHIEPFGEERGDLRAAMLGQTVAVLAGNKDAKLGDFLLKFDPQDKPRRPAMSDDALRNLFMAGTAAFEAAGGTVIRKAG